MSLSHFRHPFDIAKHPTMEPEVKRAILASWASEASAVRDAPQLRKAPGAAGVASVDDVLDALKSLDR